MIVIHTRDRFFLVYSVYSSLMCLLQPGTKLEHIYMNNYCNMMVAKGLVCDASRWTPLTLEGGAMFHLSFGAILGATAWKKKEELETHNNNKSDTT